MNYEEFKTEVLRQAEEAVSAPKTVSIHPIVKNNGLKLDGLVIMEDDTNLAPSIHLNPFYEEYKSGTPFSKIMQTILEIYESYRFEMKVNTDFFTSYDRIRPNLIYRLINYERNRELLEEVPHIRFLDLAIVFFCLYQTDDNENSGTIMIRREHTRFWEVTVSELYADAQKNTCRRLPASLTDIQSMMKRVQAELRDAIFREAYAEEQASRTGTPVSDTGICSEAEQAWQEFLSGGDGSMPMFVLTNQNCSYGATCILYQDLLRHYAEFFSCDFYLLPSSIHEMIMVPARSDRSLVEMSDMVRRVNETTIPPEEVLSDHAYYYSLEKNRITL